MHHHYRASFDATSQRRTAATPEWAHPLLLRVAAALALAVILLGATVRLADAGLSCPDWPGCFGRATVAAALERPGSERLQHWPDSPLDPARAHLEMLHRYAAGLLGMLVISIGVIARRRPGASIVGLALIALVLAQALLGLWTVTLRLEPLVVTAHLSGGISLLALLWWLQLGAGSRRPGRSQMRSWGETRAAKAAAGGITGLRLLALLGLVTLSAQILLGGWMAANHASLACQGFPTCNGQWWPALDVGAAFSPLADGRGRSDIPLSGTARITIHWSHRIGAAVALLVLGSLALLASRRGMPPQLRWSGRLLGLLLLAQIGLGIATLVSGARLPLAVAHTGVAALLLLALLTLIHRLIASPQPLGDPDASELEPFNAKPSLSH